ncbi:hypothetical protein [Streptomyces sp. NPDC051776]|uniref:hypothetical protein n=1 Tax=Streptomyces sp. NPDC051776 TaxID=3155414 RepID=UPI003432F100
MAVGKGDMGSYDSSPQQASGGRPSGNAMNADDDLVLSRWYQALLMQDSRYDRKDLFKNLVKLAAVSMSDDEFRQRLVNDTGSVLAEFQSWLNLPAGLTIKFWDNTPDTLHIVLPPRAGEASKRPEPLRNLLRSRPMDHGGGRDDWTDFGDPVDLQWNPNHGDRGKDG